MNNVVRRHQGSIVFTAVLVVILVTAPVFAQVSMVKDINPSGQGLSYMDTGVMNGLVWFAADDGATGHELWFSDGTGDGTARLLDIREGTEGSYPADFAVVAVPEVGNRLFFTANDGAAGKELWMSDGSTQGTVRLDLYPDSTSSDPKYLVAMGGLLFLVATHETWGEELWVVEDGVASVVKDIRSDATGSDPYSLAVIDLDEGGETVQWLFFGAQNDSNGTEIWRSDGTADGTTMVKDVRLGGLPSLPSFITGYNGRAWFEADDGNHGSELWVSDGTPAGTALFQDTNIAALTGSSVRDLVATGSHLFFVADDGAGMELWATDGTLEGTGMLTDTGGQFSINAWRGSAAIGDVLYLSASDGVHDSEIWISDGTPAGTHILKDLRADGPGSPGNLGAAGGLLFFTGCTDEFGCELWVSGGTENRTLMAADTSTVEIGGSGQPLTALGDLLFFSATDDTHGTEMWTVGLADIITAPDPPTGETWVSTGSDETYQTGGSVSVRGNDIEYRFHWDDTTTSGWLTAGTTEATHSWNDVDFFYVTVDARSTANPNVPSDHSDSLEIETYSEEIEEIVATPVLDGPASGWTGQDIHFTLTGDSNTDHQLQYYVDWGNGIVDWTDFPEGRTVGLSNTWDEAAEYYTIQVSVRCAVDDLAEWMDTTIEIVDPPEGWIFGDGFESGNTSAW